MADVTIEGSAYSSYYTPGHVNNTVFVTASVGYQFYLDSAFDLNYRKTTDGGASWGSAVLIRAGSIGGFCAWFDKWTPGDSGTKIHLTYSDIATSTFHYRTLDSNGDSLGTERTLTKTSGTSIGSAYHGITKTTDGVVFAAGRGASGAHFASKSSDEFASETTIASPMEANGDRIWLFPANAADVKDVRAVYLDESANEYSLKTYDDSAGTWSETSIVTVTAAVGSQIENSSHGSLRHSDNHIIFCAWTEYDVATADLVCYDITDSGTITAKTNVITNADDCYGVGVCIDQNTDDLYVAYYGKEDGSETAKTAVTVNYKKSTDDATTWGSETAYSEDAGDDFRNLWVNPGGFETRFYVTWWDDDDDDIFGGFTNSVVITAPVVSFTPRLALLGVG